MTVRNIPFAFIQYNCIPHYRCAIFRRLCAREDIEFAILSDCEPDTPYLKAVRFDPEIRQFIVRTRYLKIPKLPMLYWQWGAVRAILRNKPDCIIALGTPYSLTAWAILVLGKVLSIPVLLWSQGLLKPEAGLRWLIRGVFYRLASGHLLYGDYAKKLMSQRGIDLSRMYVVYNSLNYDDQAAIEKSFKPEDIIRRRKDLGVKEGEGLLVFTGRIQPIKRLDLLISAIGELARAGKRVHLCIVGEGSERKNLAMQTTNLRIEDLVHFLGESYDEEYIGKIFAAADLCVIPSGAGLSIMHAMTYGCPILLHDRIELHFPEWEAVREGETGFFYRYGDKSDLKRKIEQAIFQEPKKRLMSDACRRVIRDRYNPAVQEEVFVRAVLESVDLLK